MKKTILSLAMVVATSVAFGQGMMGNDKEKKSTGSSSDTPMSLEGVLSFNGSSLQWQAPTVRFRYFVNENIAGRVQIGLGDGLGSPMSETYMHRQYTNVDSALVQGQTKINRMAWNAQIGGEYHMSATDRISPYFMLGINFGGGSEKVASIDSDGADNYMAAMVLGTSWEAAGGGNYVAGYSSETEAKMSMFGIGLGAGVDIYVIENVYIGFELGFNFNSMNIKDRTYTYTDATVQGVTTTGSSEFDGYKESHLSTGAGSAAIRLGWRF